MVLKSVKHYFRLPASDILSDSLKLFSGATLGQAVPFLAGPILSRLYSPDDFGLFALLSSTAGILSIVSTGAYEYAIVTSERDEEATQLSSLSAILSLCFSIVSAIVILLILLLINPWNDIPTAWIWLLVPVYIFLQGLTNVSNYILNRQKRYGRMSKGKFIRAVVLTLLQIILGFLKIPWGLFPGAAGGHFASTWYLLKGIKGIYREAKESVSWRNLKKIASDYYRFPGFMMPSQLLNEFSIQVPVYLLKIFFTNTIVGIYALPQKILNVPVSLIGNSIGQVYFEKAARQNDNPKVLAQTTQSLFNFLFRIGVIPFSIILVFGDILFPWLFGPEWLQSGIFAQMLSPWLLFVLVGSPISKLFTVQNKQKLGLYFNTFLLSLRVIALIIGGLIFRSEVMAILLFGISGFIYWFFQSFYILSMAKVKVTPVLIQTIVIWTLVLFLMLVIRFIFLM